jgi:hypothetical protein
MAVLLVAAALAAVVALKPAGSPHRGAPHVAAGLNVSRTQRDFLLEEARGLDALSRSEFKASVSTPAQGRSASRAHRLTLIARVYASERKHTPAAHISTNSARSTPSSRAATATQSVSQRTSTAGSDSGTTAAAGTPAQTAPVQQAPAHQTPVQQTGSQQPVHYQLPPQPAGPAGLGSQVGGNCDPKCR